MTHISKIIGTLVAIFLTAFAAVIAASIFGSIGGGIDHVDAGWAKLGIWFSLFFTVPFFWGEFDS
jgi:hypothetical protein